jgi:hypothetical protein
MRKNTIYNFLLSPILTCNQLKKLFTKFLFILVGISFGVSALAQAPSDGLAPGQIPYVFSGSDPTSVIARGVNTGSNILFQGGTVGMEYLVKDRYWPLAAR